MVVGISFIATNFLAASFCVVSLFTFCLLVCLLSSVCVFVCLSVSVCVFLSSLSFSPVAPMIIEISPNQTVLAGGNVSFVCTANGNPPPIVQWIRDGLVYGSNGSSFPVTSTLELEYVTPADAGAYTCDASNDIGSSMLQSTLVVQGQHVIWHLALY